MIANVSPSGLNFDDTYNTLKYADRAKQIKTKVHVHALMNIVQSYLCKCVCVCVCEREREREREREDVRY